MFLLKNSKRPQVNEISFDFTDPGFVGTFKGCPDDTGFLIEYQDDLAFNALLEYLDYPSFTLFKSSGNLVLNKLLLIPNERRSSITFLSLSDQLSFSHTTGLEVFKSDRVEGIILYSILSADNQFSIARFKRQIRKDEESKLDFNFSVDSLGEFVELSRG